MLDKRNTIQLVSLVNEEASDQILKTQYGTNIDEFMENQHSKIVQAKIYALREEFKLIGKYKDDKITIEELVDHFKKRKVSVLYVFYWVFTTFFIMFLLYCRI